MAQPDTRVACKYGASCYQKNEAHLKRFRHDAKEAAAEEAPKLDSNSPPAKKLKADDSPAVAKAAESSPEASKAEVSPPKTKVEDGLRTFLEKAQAEPVIKKMFLVDMPDEFYTFWELCLKLDPKNPLDAFKACGIRLVGPFEVMGGVLRAEQHTPPATLTHWRFFYDPPEMQTLLLQGDQHLGYFRDEPNQPPAFVASGREADGGKLQEAGSNLFAAVDYLVASHLKTADPFAKMKLKKLQSALKAKADESKIPLHDKSAALARKRKTVCKGYHSMGLIVPYDKKSTVGYRQLETEANLKKLLDVLADESASEERKEDASEKLDSNITYANIANDECDFGGALELGLYLFGYGSPVVHAQALGLLGATYNLLGRSAFADILKAHIESGRKKDSNLSII